MKCEKDVKAKVREMLKKHGCWYCMPHGAGYGAAGIPDFVVCVPPCGKFLAVECKFGANTTTAYQNLQIADIRKAGGTSFVAHERNLELLESILDFLRVEE